MSYVNPSRNPSSLKESSSISSLTVLIILLVSCVILLLLLNCIFLGYKILISIKKRKRQRTDSESTLLRSVLSTRQTTVVSDLPTRTPQGGKDYVSLSEPIFAKPGPSSLPSSKERAAAGQRCRTWRPDRPTGRAYESLRAPSTILATMSTTNSTTRADLPGRSRLYSRRSLDWRRTVSVVPHSSDSETDRVNVVPPNSPMLTGPSSLSPTSTRPMRRSSTMELLNEAIEMGANLPGNGLERERASSIHAESSCFVASANSSALGPGFDSDFGASAGISLRILSCDSEGLSNGLCNSALEWDYYDPTYVSQNNVPKHMYHLPTVTAKQYWV